MTQAATNVTLLPTAAAEPVINAPRRGRYPGKVTKISPYRRWSKLATADNRLAVDTLSYRARKDAAEKAVQGGPDARLYAEMELLRAQSFQFFEMVGKLQTILLLKVDPGLEEAGNRRGGGQS